MNLLIRNWIKKFCKLLEEANQLPNLHNLEQQSYLPTGAVPGILPSTPICLIFSPHPDDETICGLLPLRLRLECNWTIINVPVSLGRHIDQRVRRKKELLEACSCTGFNVYFLEEWGLDFINPEHKTENPSQWKKAVKLIAQTIKTFNPIAIFCPHKDDVHPAHKGTNLMLNDALYEIGNIWKGWIIETEFWAPMNTPNLMVEASIEDVAILLEALLCYKGEISRNPYHVAYLCWLVDNVRRGCEIIGGMGSKAPPFLFALIYTMLQWDGNSLKPYLPPLQFLSVSERAEIIFQ